MCILSKIIQELKKTHSRVTTALNELESLENDDKIDFHEINYEDIYIKYRFILHTLERRRETLQKRGRTQ